MRFAIAQYYIDSTTVCVFATSKLFLTLHCNFLYYVKNSERFCEYNIEYNGNLRETVITSSDSISSANATVIGHIPNLLSCFSHYAHAQCNVLIDYRHVFQFLDAMHNRNVNMQMSVLGNRDLFASIKYLCKTNVFQEKIFLSVYNRHPLNSSSY